MFRTGKDKTYSRNIFKIIVNLSVPTIIEELLSTLLQYVDTAMVGQLGEDAAASVSVTTTISWLISSIPSAISVAALAMISKAIGSGDSKKIQDISRHTALTVPVIGIFLGVVSVVLSPFIPTWMGADISIQEQASLYFFIISLSMLFRCSGIIFGAALRAAADVKTPLYINFTANTLNAVLNYLLIYKAELGVTGAAIATSVSYTVSGILMFAAYRKNKLLSYKLERFKIDEKILREGGRIGLPVLGTSAASCLGYVVFASLVTGMGNTVFAAHSIAVTAETIFYISGYGLRTATSTLVGISFGERDSRKFETVCRLSAFMTVSMMILSGIILYFSAEPLMRLFISSEEAALLGAEMLKIVALSEPFYGLMIVTEGIFYGLGRTRYAFVIETLSMWGIRIIFTYICVRIWGCGLREVWLCMIADNIFKALMFIIPVCTQKGRAALFSEKQ